MPLYNGPDQQAECQRSGAKCRASELVRDGRNPGLLVLPEWADPYDPLEHPYLPDAEEGVAQFPLSPENLPNPLLTLAGIYNGAGTIALSWTVAQLIGPRAENYVLYKTIDGVSSVFGTYPLDYRNTTGHVPNIGVKPDYGHIYYVQQAVSDPNAGVTNPNDSHFAAVTLLLHCDGVDGANTFIDSSAIGNIVTAQQHAVTSTTNPKFGSAAYFVQSGFSNCLAIPNTSGGPLDLSTGDFTVEGWFNTLSANAFSQIVIGAATTAGPNGWYIAFAPTPNRQLFASIYTAGGGQQSVAGPAFTSQDVWHHFAFVRNGSLFRIFVDGIHEPTGDITQAASIGPTTPVFNVGSINTGVGSVSLDHLDEIRVTKGFARYTADFTPPNAPFADISTATGHVYTYHIEAVDSLGEAVATSNTLTLTVSGSGAGVIS